MDHQGGDGEQRKVTDGLGRTAGRGVVHGAVKWTVGRIVAWVLTGLVVLGGGGCAVFEATDDDSDDDGPTTSQDVDD